MSNPSDETRQFIQTLWPSPLEGQFFLFWGAPSKQSEWVSSAQLHTHLDVILASLSKWAGKENVYLGCASRRQDFGKTIRGAKEDCTAIPGLWLDIDYGPDHKKPNLPPTEEEARALINEMGLLPTMIVHSGRGLQAWWCFREPWVFENDEERDAAERLAKRWSSTLREKCKAHGWDADQVGDLPRVMRLPGTWNRKGVPTPTKLLACDEFIRYNPEEFLQFMVEQKEDAPQHNLSWTFDLNPNAEPPASKFLLLSEIDSSFKLGWLEKLNLQDKSPSSYDLSQATRAFAADWTPQEIVNLLIARRRLHKHDLKLRKDYYERTLTVAVSSKPEEARRQIVEGVKAGQAVPDEVKKDPAEVLAICSEIIGVSVTKFVRFRGEPNTYQLTTNNRVVNVDCIEDLAGQSRFRNLILDHTDVLIQLMKPQKWIDFINLFFSAIENVQLSDDATMKGSYENWIELYLAELPISDTDWQTKALEGSPFVKDGKTYIVSEGFRKYLWGAQQEKVSSRHLTAALAKCGYIHERINFRFKNKQNKRSVWVVG